MNITHKRYDKLKSIVQKCKLFFDTSDPFRICKLLEIKVHIVSLEGLYGFSNIPNSANEELSISNASIFLSNKLNSYSRKIVCAHELGHILLQGNEQLNLFDIENTGNDLAEYEANLFAIELMPDIYILPIDYHLLSRKELYNYMNNIISF